MIGRALTMLAVAAACIGGPAAAETASPAPAPARDFARFDRLTLRSYALGEEVKIRIQHPALGIHPSTVVLVALMPQPEVARIAADLRKRELETSMYGVVVVSLDAAGPLDSDALAESLAGPVYADRPSRFSRFLTEELKALVAKELGLRGEMVLAGSGVFGRVVLESAVEERGVFDEYVVVDPKLEPAEAAAIAGKRGPSGGAYSNINVLRWPREPGEPPVLDALLDSLAEGSFYIDVQAPHPDALNLSDFVRDRTAQTAIVPPH